MTDESRCRWGGDGRVVPDRHLPECEGDCAGCQPCTRRHCMICTFRHAEVTCASCTGDVRDDLDAILELCGLGLEREVLTRGVDSEAFMLAGPVANPEAWSHRAMSAMQGRVDDSYLEDCRDEQHPVWVLGTWENLWREHLDHATTDTFSIGAAWGYLTMQLTYMAGRIEPDFGQFAREVRGCRAHLEDVLHDGERDETGAPCPECHDNGVKHPPALVLDRDDADRTGAGDRWRCPKCKHSWKQDEYEQRVDDKHISHASELTMTDMVKRTLVAAGTLRRWAGKQRRSIGGVVRESPPLLKPSGKHPDGRRLYRVDDVIALRDGDDTSAVA